MCRATRCKTCGNITWAGCGRHVAQVNRVARGRQQRLAAGPTAKHDDIPSPLRYRHIALRG